MAVSVDGNESRQIKSTAAMLRLLGYVETIAVDRERGRATLVYQAGAQHCNDDNVVQGGIVSSWVDAAMASAVFAMGGPRTKVASLEIKTTYLKPVSSGKRIRVEGWVLKLGRTTAFMEGRVFDEVDNVLATASSTALVRDAAPSRAGGSGG